MNRNLVRCEILMTTLPCFHEFKITFVYIHSYSYWYQCKTGKVLAPSSFSKGIESIYKLKITVRWYSRSKFWLKFLYIRKKLSFEFNIPPPCYPNIKFRKNVFGQIEWRHNLLLSKINFCAEFKGLYTDTTPALCCWKMSLDLKMHINLSILR